MYTFKQNLVSKSKYSIKCPYEMKAEYIVVHNTYNDASAENEIKYMISNNNQVSYHVAIDDKEAMQGIPFNRNAWHSSDGANGKGNRKGIAIEICYSKSGGDKFIQAEKNASQYIAKLLKERGWNTSKVKRHYDFATNKKYCPHRTMDMGWDRFLNMVQKELDKLNKPTTSVQQPSTSTTSIKVGDKVKVKTTATKYATGQAMSSFVKGSTYTVEKVDGNKLLLSDIKSWVWDYDVEKVGSQSFLVEIICNELNIRQSSDFNSKVVGTVKKGDVYTIIEESNGLGKLKSGAGWISMGSSYVKKK